MTSYLLNKQSTRLIWLVVEYQNRIYTILEIIFIGWYEQICDHLRKSISLVSKDSSNTTISATTLWIPKTTGDASPLLLTLPNSLHSLHFRNYYSVMRDFKSISYKRHRQKTCSYFSKPIQTSLTIATNDKVRNGNQIR